ncbi:hypothetical protein HMPREF1212_05302 [Parabacteroides sp. HGS0025]|uniref:LamG domain-containing protein n=1 Tax=Parabacteroides sp. HGS0025 TaxID=1078087 RepID=UPI0006178051|nr:LamG domain-containing protein [Parabacteroides sp. HGS0025]KKB45134.1 hypothetical protein HMPREF1212_05302 [Parabacteroides sp. HGS0025]
MSRRRMMELKQDKNTVSLFHCDDTNGTDAKGFATVQSKSLVAVVGKFGDANVGYAKYQLNQWENLILNSDWTIDFWIYPGIKNDWQVVLYLGGDSKGTANIRLQVDSNQSKLVFFLSNGSGWIVNGDSVGIKLAEWQHVALVYPKNTKTLMLFVDGIEKYSHTFNPTSAPGSYHYIGAGWSSNINDNSYRDEIRFSNVARWTTNFIPPTNPYN